MKNSERENKVDWESGNSIVVNSLVCVVCVCVFCIDPRLGSREAGNPEVPTNTNKKCSNKGQLSPSKGPGNEQTSKTKKS